MFKNKNKLCTPLFNFFTRTSSSIPQHLHMNFSPHIQLSAYVSPSPSSTFSLRDRTLRNPAYYYSIGNLGFSGKWLCSKSAEKLHSISRCWNCHAVPESAPFLFCESCRCIQPVDDSVDYFQIFGLENKYDVDVENLGAKYKEWQKKLHPDLVHSKSQKERDFAAEQSARVIDAYRTLSRPLSRAIYLLKLSGEQVDEEQTISDPELLAEILEIREAVEEATNSKALNHILSQMQEKLNNWSNAFGNAFESRNFEEAKISIRRMTYYDRVIDEVVKKL